MGWFNFKDMALRKKIVLIAVVSTSISLLTACLIFVLYERVTYPKIKIQSLSAWAQIIGDNATAALSFNDPKTAEEMLKILKANPRILSACLYDAKGQVFAWYQREKNTGKSFPAVAGKTEADYSGGSIKVDRDIFSGGDRIGSIYLESDTQEMRSRMANYVIITVLIGFFSFVVSVLVASRLQRHVTVPLRQVVDRMRDIALGEGDLTKRLQVEGKDEIGEVSEAFNTFVGKLQTVEEMKLDLISIVSHQLKTPVAEINGFIENMTEGLTGPLNQRQKEYLDEMRSIGQGNYRLICDLLSASKIERGVVFTDLKAVSVKEVVDLAIRDYEAPLQRKGLSLRLEGTEGGLALYADRDKMVEVLRNLLNNAIKCTDKGSITIKAGSEGGQGVIEVKDTGIGMNQETLDQLFTKNRMLGKEARRSGAGLGLYISKSFMKLQKGDITVTSEVGKGTCFKLTIPWVKLPEMAVL